MKTNWDKIRELVKTTDKAILTKVVQSIDGHTIYDAKQFTGFGLDPKIVNAFTKVLKSNPDNYKQTLFVAGRSVESLKGVYGLDLLEFIASVFGVTSWKLGRGSRADHLSEQLVASNFTDVQTNRTKV